jgi:hypothetical protein
MPAKFVRMGVLRRYCAVGPKWMERKITLGFQGTIHGHRQRFFNELNSMGMESQYSHTVVTNVI